MVGKGCRHVAFVSDIAQKDTLVNVDRLIWKASQVRGQISKRNWISISRLERHHGMLVLLLGLESDLH